MNINFVVAALSGLFAGSSACTMAVYPALLNRMTGSREDPKWVTVFFTLGLSGVYFLVYVVFGAFTSFLGLDFLDTAELWRGRLTLIGALFSWIMAWSTLRGGIRLPAVRILKIDAQGGYFGALFTGFVYGTMISPCNAAFLFTGILPALVSSSSVSEGILLLAVFSFAMGLPMLLLGWASGKAIESFSILKNNTRKLEVISAVFLVAVGFYFLYLFLLTL